MIKRIVAQMALKRKYRQEQQSIRAYWRAHYADALFPRPKPVPVGRPPIRKGWIDGGGRWR